MESKRTPAGNTALGGVLAALAITVMAMGTLIPVATYVCPMLCCLLLKTVTVICGKRYAWAWYGAVALLSLLLAPDKEAAVVFVFLGYYPIVKPALDRKPAPWLWKMLLFNIAALSAYWLMLRLLGMEALAEEFAQMGAIMAGVLLLMGNITFFLLDRLLGMKLPMKK